MRDNFFNHSEESHAEKKLIKQEDHLIFFSEMINNLMEHKSISKTDLALKLGKSKSWITQLLDGTHNPSLRTISDILFELDSQLKFEPLPLDVTLTLYFNNKHDNPTGGYNFIHRNTGPTSSNGDEVQCESGIESAISY